MIASMKPTGASIYAGMPVGTLMNAATDTAAAMQIRFVSGWVIVLIQASEIVLFRP